MSKVLIADDNRQIVAVLEEYARKDGFEVDRAYDGEQALTKALVGAYDIILLDVMMPVKDGFEVCREIRKLSAVPIILVTARGEDFERIMGLDIGADDYIVKPFSPGEVMARVRAILRRLTPSDQGAVCRLDGLRVSLDDYLTEVEGQLVALTKKETELLWTLANYPGKVFTRQNLLESVWGFDFFGDTRTVDSHIKRLRAKLAAIPHPTWEIVTIWGVGYKLEVRK
ncbi:MAG: response regulator transcription factor [Propionibacteriaceae bacterium]|jgi:DNA-binding response OmpR family regulator|nr:response regulator transcription factor [Propionibacteriaceae bacterium]